MLVALACLLTLQTNATTNDSTTYYSLPDSVRGTAFITDLSFRAAGKKAYAGIGTKQLSLLLKKEKNAGSISFHLPAQAQVITTGWNAIAKNNIITWKFDWQLNTPYKLMIATAADSAENFSLCSGYIYLPDAQKWKLIGTSRISSERQPIAGLKAIRSAGKKKTAEVLFTNAGVQTANGRWRNLEKPGGAVVTPPFLSNVDSVEQLAVERALIEAAIATGRTDVNQNSEGVFYRVLEPGTGRSFTAADSITAKYQLRIFGTTEVISGNETDTYTFLLGSLIKGWQLAVPLVKTGGRIKLVIPSALAYSIRTRAPKIPPNSILEFHVEVLDARPAQR